MHLDCAHHAQAASGARTASFSKGVPPPLLRLQRVSLCRMARGEFANLNTSIDIGSLCDWRDKSLGGSLQY